MLVTISDKKIGVVANDGSGLVGYYNADVITANDYYPFGMKMPGRTFTQANTKYRYGFNGKESDNEIKGDGNALDFGDRSIYDPRLGRFISIDPNYRNLPDFSPYQYARNNPIMLVENGKDGIIPKWLWKTGVINPMAAGFIDAVADDVKGIVSIGQVIAAFDPQHFYFYTPSASQVRHETWQTTKTVFQVMNNPVLQALVITSIAQDVMKTVKDADASDYAYATGYAAWNVLSFFVGAGEAASFAKTGKVGVGLEKFLGILSKSEGKIDHLANIIKRSATHLNDIEWHHVIPTQLKEIDVVEDAISAGYKFEEQLGNKIPLEKFLNINKEGVHGNHPQYTNQITAAINKFRANNPKYSKQQAKAFLDDINSQAQKAIDENPTTKINELKLNLQVKTNY